MCPKAPKIKKPKEYRAPQEPEIAAPDSSESAKGRRATLLTSMTSRDVPTTKKTLLGQ